MSVTAIVYLVIIGALLLCSAFFSSSEMAFAKVNHRRLKEAVKKGKKSAKLALAYAEDYDRLIVTVLFGNSLVNILASSLAASLSFHEPFSSIPNASTIIAGVMLVLVLTFGEILPKAIAKGHPYALALAWAYPVRFFEIIFFPIVKGVSAIASFICKPFGKKKVEAATDEELQAMVDEIEEQGFIDEDQSELLHASIEFKETSAYEVMTPRVKIEGVNIKHDLNKYVLREDAFRHSRIPVYVDNYDHIVGYIPVKSLQHAMLRGEKLTFESLMQPILEVPGTMEVSSILALMKKTRHHIALVKDEWGGTDGIVTLEDILEELVGEMYDESETIHANVMKGPKRNVYFCRGSMDIEEVVEKFHLNEENIEGDSETLSGWITDHLGRFPKVGDAFEYEKITVEVTKDDSVTVKEARITYHPRRKISE